ncbi:hypothetical protein D6810_00805 [Candidatus Dojkabacteria bacterium]|uniref:Uncharacterized protein n=1 Tax=Candidatus Dojkabacteria bacterium TaxID=2099670 RepID=A0A3M0Z0C7_9BACT|nr:MAG: hypothetical protein D6810_00805 [Candidatus Dojkabacteria bacterium]
MTERAPLVEKSEQEKELFRNFVDVLIDIGILELEGFSRRSVSDVLTNKGINDLNSLKKAIIEAVKQGVESNTISERYQLIYYTITSPKPG